MPTKTFEFDDFADEFTLAGGDDPTSWPAMSATFTFKFHPPEPDVGIDYNQLEVQNTAFAIDGKAVKDQEQFVASVYQAISEDIEEGEDFVAGMVEAFLLVWEQKLYEWTDD